eukprot:13845731-Heterocapsa_arctica.AAC.1
MMGLTLVPLPFHLFHQASRVVPISGVGFGPDRGFALAGLGVHDGASALDSRHVPHDGEGSVAPGEYPFVSEFAFGFRGSDGKHIPRDAEDEFQRVEASPAVFNGLGREGFE